MPALRVCLECGCDISHLNAISFRCVPCQTSVERANKRARSKSRGYGNATAPNQSKKPATIRCPACAGMPDARQPGRYDERRREIAPEWECIECGEPYEDPPEIHAVATIGSSAGTAADHGRLHGLPGQLEVSMRAISGSGPIVRRCIGYRTEQGPRHCPKSEKIYTGKSRCVACAAKNEEGRRLRAAREAYERKKGENDGG